MRTFHCDRCQTPVYFENIRCLGCGSTVGILPDSYEVHSVEKDGSGTLAAADGNTYRLCKNSIAHSVCNQLVPSAEKSDFCLSCRFTGITPDLTFANNLGLWGEMEIAKRRLLFSLHTLGIRPAPKSEDPAKGLSFHFLVDNCQGILTGHSEGVITITLAEADPAIREARRQQMGEDYRTLLGHFRHEVGHYYWDRLIADRGRQADFRAAFGDERADYDAALASYYSQMPGDGWRGNHVSRYASAHAHEDWAETFAHFLHMRDVVETAVSVGLVTGIEEGAPLPFQQMADLWLSTSFRLNQLGRSMGSGDLYPFILSDKVIEKMHFISDVIEDFKAGK